MRALAIAAFVACGCGGPARAVGPGEVPDALPDVRIAKDRPPVVIVARDGDPAIAVAAATTTAGIGDEPESSVALAGVLEARLRSRGIRATVTPAWDGLRAVAIAEGTRDAAATTDAIRDAMLAKIEEKDVAPAKKKLEALAQRPLRAAALAPWARCVGAPFAMPDRARKPLEPTAAALERWRAAAFGLGRVAIGVAGTRPAGEVVAAAIAKGSPWATAASAIADANDAPANDVYEITDGGDAVVHVALDVGASSAAVAAAEALGDPRGPLASRLSELDLPFRVREVTGTAHARGGCVGVVLQATRNQTSELAPRVADAVALVEVEVDVHLAEAGASKDGRLLARRTGDAREAAERAAWWALADKSGPSRRARAVALGVPVHRSSPEKIEPDKDTLAAAIDRALAAWKTPAVEGRTRIEAGQGETWVLFASPCGTDAESDVDAGLTAVIALAAAENTRTPLDTRVEPWIAADGVGLVVHGPPRSGESPQAHARRLADIVGRSFAADPLPSSAIARARTDLLRRDVPALATLASALSPQHPSWVLAHGTADAVARSSDAAVIARAQAVRAGPLRVAVLAADDTQGPAAQRAADRWVARRAGDTRACRAPAEPAPPRAGTYAVNAPAGTMPEALLAFPFPAGDPAARAASNVVVAALDGEDGLLERALAGLAQSSSARVLGFPRVPSIVIRIAAREADLDGAVVQARALVDRLQKGALPAEEIERAIAREERRRVSTLFDPRARLVATFRGEGAPARATVEDVRAFAKKHLAEDGMIVVASRPQRPARQP